MHLLTAVQAVLGGLTSAFVARLAWRCTADLRAAAAAGLLTAAYGPLVFVDAMVLAEGLLICLLLAAVLAPFEVRTGVIRALASGALIGAAALVRPTAAALLPLLAWLLVRRSAGSRTKWRLVGALLVAAALVVSPVLWTNWRATGSPMIQAYFGLNAYLGNSPGGDGLPSARLGGGWQQLDTEARRAGAVTPAVADRYYLAKLAGEWRERPGAASAVLAGKAIWFLQGEEVRDTHSFWFFRAQSRLLGLLPTFAWILPIASVGVLVAVRQRRSDLLVVGLGYILAMGLTAVLLVMAFRYRLPIAPMLCLFAGVGLVDVVESAGRGAWRQVATALGVVVLGVGVENLRTHVPSHNFSEEWAFEGMALSSERRPSEARAAFSRALAADQKCSLARRGLGLLAYNQQDWNGAREEFRRAVATDPSDAFSLRYLGLSSERAGNLREAIEHLREADTYRPDDLIVMMDLARVLARAGAYGDAIDVLRRMTLLAPRDPLVRTTLAGMLVLTNRPAEAIREVDIVPKLDTRDPRVPCMTAIVRLLGGSPAAADLDLARCEQTAGRTAPVRLLTGLVAFSNGRDAEARRELALLGVEAPEYSPVAEYLTKPRNSTQQAEAVHGVLVKALIELVAKIGL